MEQNGWAEFRIKKADGKWKINMNEDDLRRMINPLYRDRSEDEIYKVTL